MTQIKENKFESAFIVKDAKTYVNAEEAWFQFSGKKKGSILFIIIPKKDPNNTLGVFEEVIDDEKWEKIIWYQTFSNYAPRDLKRRMKKSRVLTHLLNGKEYICNMLDRIGLDRLAEQFGPVKTVFSGHRNTQEHLAAVLEPKDLYIMDSGRRIQKRIQGNGYINYRPYFRRNPIKYIFHKLSGFKVFDREKTKIFTVYSETVKTKHQVVKNDYLYRKMLLDKKEMGDLTFFISSPLYNRQHVSIEQHIDFVREVFRHLDLDSKNVVYIPHPTYEGEEEVELIVNKLGCKADSRDIPVENKITMYDRLPAMCVSPYSTALENLSVFAGNKFPIVCAWHDEFSFFKYLYEWKEKSLQKKNSNIEFVTIKNATSLFGLRGKNIAKPYFKDFEEWDATKHKDSSLKIASGS